MNTSQFDSSSPLGALQQAPTQQVGMTLAEIAYAEPQNIARQLAYPYYATAGAWTLQWLGVSAGNQMYVCRNQNSGQWAVVIRGSVTDPFEESFWIDWFEQDLTALHMVDFPYDKERGGKIAWGTKEGLYDLLGMRDAIHQETLVEFLSQRVSPEPLSVVVIGHSLGGSLASVLAPALYELIWKPKGISSSILMPLTFAAPTAGDTRFARYVEELFGGYPFRYENSLDAIPHAWSLSGLDWILASYQPAPQISDILYGLVDTTWWILYEGNYRYKQPGSGIIAPGTLQNYYWWFEEAGYQHSGETYLRMYKAPTVHFPLPPKSPIIGVEWRKQRAALRSAASKE